MGWMYSLAFLIASANPFSNYFRKLTDPTFRGIYKANAFDLAVMLPYFAVLAVLAIYGMHRYLLVYNFYKYRHRQPPVPSVPAEWPEVIVQLPIYNERYVIERLIECVAQFDYPRDRMHFQVLDDSTDETREIARACVERYQQLGLPITYHHRDEPRGLQGRRAAGGIAIGPRRVRGHLRRRFHAAARFSSPHDSVFLRREARHGADALELREPELFRAHRSRSDSARRPFRHRARRAIPPRRIFQFQRHRRGLAARRHRRGRRLAARYAHRRHRSFLPCPALRLAFPVSAGDRLPVGIAGGDERVQGPAGALGQGPDADGQKNTAACAALARAPPS